MVDSVAILSRVLVLNVAQLRKAALYARYRTMRITIRAILTFTATYHQRLHPGSQYCVFSALHQVFVRCPRPAFAVSLPPAPWPLAGVPAVDCLGG